MIDAKELRIGNKVLKNGVFVCDVLSLRRNEIEISFEKEIYALEYKNVHPIALTEEILMRCGFEKIGYSNPHTTQWKLGDILIGFCNGTIYFDYININGVKKGCCFQYLHVLQNLIHSLTGHELNVNL